MRNKQRVTAQPMGQSKRREINRACSKRGRDFRKAKLLLINRLCDAFTSCVHKDVAIALRTIEQIKIALSARVDDVEIVGLEDLPELTGDEPAWDWGGLRV